MQLEGFVGVVFPDDALGVMVLEPVPAGLGMLDFHIAMAPSGVCITIHSNLLQYSLMK